MQARTIAEQLFFSTMRIDTLTDGAPGTGTGFGFMYKVANLRYPFIVTNKHVVMGMQQGALTFIKRDGELPKLGDCFRTALEDWPQRWFGHPSPDIDIAVCPLGPIEAFIKKQHGIDLFYRYVTNDAIPNEEQANNLDAVEPVTFIGYPNGVWDSKNYLPIARRGTTATPIGVDFEGTPRFLIDASVFGGSSGSPVFVYDQGIWLNNGEGIVVSPPRFLFVGVIAAVYFRTHLNEIVPVPIPTKVKPMAKQEEMIDLGVVFKSRTVVETIEAFFKAIGHDPAVPPPPDVPIPEMMRGAAHN